jgi:hypothetical protein
MQEKMEMFLKLEFSQLFDFKVLKWSSSIVYNIRTLIFMLFFGLFITYPQY